MKGNVGNEELHSALNLSENVKSQIKDYETRNWAANLSASNMSDTWSQFISKLDSAIKEDKLDDGSIINLINYLSTIDTASLLEQIGKLNPARQNRFLELLNWMAQKSPVEEKKLAAEMVRERILMTHRMNKYPEIYSPTRLARAAQIVLSLSN
jgi:hypothetical protein